MDRQAPLRRMQPCQANPRMRVDVPMHPLDLGLLLRSAYTRTWSQPRCGRGYGEDHAPTFPPQQSARDEGEGG